MYKIIRQKSEAQKLSQERIDLKNILNNLSLLNEKIIILAGAQKIGITFSILQIVKCNSILYLDLYTLFNHKGSYKRKYVFQRFMNLFIYYDEY